MFILCYTKDVMRFVSITELCNWQALAARFLEEVLKSIYNLTGKSTHPLLHRKSFCNRTGIGSLSA